MASNQIGRNDPAPAFCFKVTIEADGVSAGAAFFRNVSGLKFESEVLDVRAGGVNHTTFRLPGTTKWGNLVLKRGYTSDQGLLNWRKAWIDGSKQRGRVTIQQLDTAMQPMGPPWVFTHAWPVKWEVSDYDATKSELSIETLELAHHGPP
jgi:phage tail-like protein